MTRLAIVAAAFLAVVLVACTGGDDAAPTGPAVSTVTAGSEMQTAGATETADATPTGATATATSMPTPEATETPSEPVASTFFVPTQELPRVQFTAGDGETVELPVEVPPTSEYSIGLSGRTELEGRGMVFYYPEVSGGPGFWMKNTHIDLDIAFVDGDREIILITRMEAESEETHHPGEDYLAAIEAPAGWYAEHGIEEGDEVEFLFDPEDHLDGG